MRSLGAKLALATGAVLLVVGVVAFAVLTAAARRTLLEDKTKAAGLVADFFAASAAAPLDFGDDTDVDHVLQNLRVDSDIVFAGVWRMGVDKPVATLGDRGEARPPSAAQSAPSWSRIDADGILVARRVTRPDGTGLGTALLRFSLAPEQTAIAHAQRGIFVGLLATLALTLLLILTTVRLQIVRPLGRLAEAARRLGSGDTVVPVAVSSHDELGELGAVFNTMSAAIVDREVRLADAVARLRELFDHMRQGIVVFGRDGVVREAPSREASLIFGGDVVGEKVHDLLYRGAAADGPEAVAFEEWLLCAFDVPFSAWGELKALAPPRVTRSRPEGPQWLELEWIAVAKGDDVDRVMLLATDVTHERRLERDAELKDEAHAREMGAMRRLLAGGGEIFARFLERAAAVVGELDAHAGAPAPPPTLVMKLHTLRGEARTFELEELAGQLQAIERIADAATADLADAAWRQRLTAAKEAAVAAIDRARGLFIEASPTGSAVLDQTTVRRTDVLALEARAAGLPDDARQLIAALSSRPFGECVSGLAVATERWADENGKRARLTVVGKDVRVPPAIARALTATLPHFVRNAIAHGIEAPAARKTALKNETGSIRVAATAEPLVITVTDDGRGLDEATIRARAAALGLPEAPAAELVFVGGLSTFPARAEIAGYGLGMSAALHDLTGAGCSVVVRSDQGRGLEVSVSVRPGV